MHQSSFHRMQRFADHIKDRHRGAAIRVLDVGSAGVNGTYRALFQFPGASYTGLDIAPGPNVDLVPRDPYEWSEIADESFDVVVSGQALEHIEFPWLTVAQIARKLRPTGMLCLIVPSRGPEHRYPVDCYRYYPDGLRALCRHGGLRVLEADYYREPSGFTDGSDQWGDCYCIATRDVAAVVAPAPTAPSASAPPALAPRLARHGYSPLRHQRTVGYFAHPREDALGIMEQVLGDALRPAAGAPRQILELGCAGGATGKALRQRYQAQVTGLERDEAAVTIARAALDQVHQVDLDQVDGAGLLALGLSPGRFDVLLALDVLEHLYDPWEVLCRHVELVRPGGHVVISLPNIQNITTLLGLSEGQWSYQAEGILDATHLRFFTLPTAELLVSGAGLKMVHLASVFNPPLDQSRLKDQDNQISHGRLTLSKLAREEVFTFFAYQYLLVAQRPLSDNRGAAAALAT